ncbi:ABC transporter permease [Streptomyces sp. NPDC087300]|uniref:ABC transporter permease n=1 Tax=Streptomyces sp. NPDC087300 TaxID=3365780 RepID=UPI00380D152F
MNLFKRARWRLTGHLGKTLMLVGLFFVICTLVLSGFLIQSAAARAADAAKQRVGAVATMQLDVNGLIGSGKTDKPDGPQGGTIGAEGDLRASLVDKICKSSAVAKCNYSTDGGAFPTKSTKLHQPVPPPQGQDSLGTDLFSASGILDIDEVKEFRNGDSKLIAGHGITPDSKDDEIVVEERVAKDNGLKVGDRMKLMVGVLPGAGQERDKREYSFKVVGIYKNSTPDSGQYVPAMMAPANRLYVTPGGGSKLDGKGTKDTVLKNATFTLKDPGDLDRLKKDAEAAGADLRIFPITVNDKQYKALVGPINKTADFASVTVWLVAVAGTVILALIVASSLRERRKELGILLSLGEKKPRLLGQHLVEVVACAVVAIGLAGACSQVLSQSIGDKLLAGEVSSAKEEASNKSQEPDYSNSMGNGGGDKEPEAEPISSMDIRIGAGDIGKVGATGLGIAALATLVPGSRVLRLNPRDILTKGD